MDRLQRLIMIRKSADWQILAYTYDMSKVCILGGKYGDTSLHMRSVGCLIIPVESNKSFTTCQIIHPWDSIGVARDDVGQTLPVRRSDMIPIRIKEATTRGRVQTTR